MRNALTLTSPFISSETAIERLLWPASPLRHSQRTLILHRTACRLLCRAKRTFFRIAHPSVGIGRTLSSPLTGIIHGIHPVGRSAHGVICSTVTFFIHRLTRVLCGVHGVICSTLTFIIHRLTRVLRSVHGVICRTLTCTVHPLTCIGHSVAEFLP